RRVAPTSFFWIWIGSGIWPANGPAVPPCAGVPFAKTAGGGILGGGGGRSPGGPTAGGVNSGGKGAAGPSKPSSVADGASPAEKRAGPARRIGAVDGGAAAIAPPPPGNSSASGSSAPPAPGEANPEGRGAA